MTFKYETSTKPSAWLHLTELRHRGASDQERVDVLVNFELGLILSTGRDGGTVYERLGTREHLFKEDLKFVALQLGVTMGETRGGIDHIRDSSVTVPPRGYRG